MGCLNAKDQLYCDINCKNTFMAIIQHHSQQKKVTLYHTRIINTFPPRNCGASVDLLGLNCCEDVCNCEALILVSPALCVQQKPLRCSVFE